MINTLLFDFDGTLCDTARGVHSAANILLERHGLDPLPYEIITHFIGGGSEKLIERIDDHIHHRLGKIRESMIEFHQIYDNIVTEQSKLYSGVMDTLKSWPGKLAIVSNKNEKYVNKLVAHTELKSLPWGCVIGGDTLAEKKPHPLPIEHALKELGAQVEEAALIGDGRPDALAAKAAGVSMIGVTYGYSTEGLLRELGVETFISHISELPTHLPYFDNSPS